jgi:tetratricopeptide (TPR) repeat protein
VIGEQRLAQVETARGDYEPARERLERVLSMARRSREPMVRAHSLGRILATLAENRLEAGDLAAATRHVARGYAIREQVGECAGCDVLLYPAAVRVYLAHGDLELAAAACRSAADVATAFSSTAWVASARYLQGLLDVAHGHQDAAATRLREAASMFADLGQPYEEARACEALAAVVSDDEATVALAHAEERYWALNAAGALRRLKAASVGMRRS